MTETGRQAIQTLIDQVCKSTLDAGGNYMEGRAIMPSTVEAITTWHWTYDEIQNEEIADPILWDWMMRLETIY